MGQEGKTHSDFPMGTQVIPYVHPPANLSPEVHASSSSA